MSQNKLSKRKPINAGGNNTVSGSEGRKKAVEKDDDLAIKPVNKYLDLFLGILFASLFVYLIWSLRKDIQMLALFVASLVFVAFGVKIVAYVSSRFGKWVSSCRKGKHIPEDCRNPMKSPLQLRKFSDQAWQLTCHTLMAAAEIYLLSGTTWWEDPASTFKPCPRDFVEGREERPFLLKAFYIFQLAIWVWTGFSCKWIEARRKDYVEMMTHHVATVMLVLFSFLNEEQAIGLVILFAHDFSDIVLDIMKMVNYMKLEGRHGYYIVEFFFGLNTFVTWPYFRLYYFPLHIIYHGVFGGYVDYCGEGEGSRLQKCQNTGSCLRSTGLLTLLASLHVFWFFLLLRILYKLVTAGSRPSRAGKEVYEGDSE